MKMKVRVTRGRRGSVVLAAELLGQIPRTSLCEQHRADRRGGLPQDASPAAADVPTGCNERCHEKGLDDFSGYESPGQQHS